MSERVCAQYLINVYPNLLNNLKILNFKKLMKIKKTKLILSENSDKYSNHTVLALNIFNHFFQIK